MSSLETQSHVVWDCIYHIVIVPKYRKKLLFEPLRAQVGKMLRDLARQKESEIIEGHALPDHIHLVIRIPPKYSVAYVMGFMKGKSAIRLHNMLSARRRAAPPRFFWSRGYFVRTVGIDEDTVKKYVQEQWKRDQLFDGPAMDLRWE
jgi:putative transposase